MTGPRWPEPWARIANWLLIADRGLGLAGLGSAKAKAKAKAKARASFEQPELQATSCKAVWCVVCAPHAPRGKATVVLVRKEGKQRRVVQCWDLTFWPPTFYGGGQLISGALNHTTPACLATTSSSC
jgi:hypothetical protein